MKKITRKNFLQVYTCLVGEGFTIGQKVFSQEWAWSNKIGFTQKEIDIMFKTVLFNEQTKPELLKLFK